MRGLYTIFRKELSDYLISWRGIILFAVALLVTVIAIYGPSGALINIRAELAEPTQYGATEFVFLKLFTTSGEGYYPFIWFISMILVPIIGVTLGFDAINGERSNGTLSRLMAQPVHRDTIFNAKFMAGIVTMVVMLATIILLVAGLGMRVIGVPPSSEEVVRLFLFLVLTTLYGAFWLGLSMLFSVFFRRVATSAMAGIAIWVFFTFFMLTIAAVIADSMVPLTDAANDAKILMRHTEIELMVMRFSPIGLFNEAVSVLLQPEIRTLGAIPSWIEVWMLDNPISLGQSLLIVWRHLVALLALTAICFAVAYIKFMREEIRST